MANKLGKEPHRVMGGRDSVNERLGKMADNFGKCATKARLTMGVSGKLGQNRPEKAEKK